MNCSVYPPHHVGTGFVRCRVAAGCLVKETHILLSKVLNIGCPVPTHGGTIMASLGAAGAAMTAVDN